MKPKIQCFDLRTRSSAGIHLAGWMLTEPQTLVEKGWLLAEKGIIREIGRGRIPASIPVQDHGPGLLLPAFANAHTHLELSALQGRISLSRGFRFWVKELLEKRAALGEEKLKTGAAQGIRELKNSGCIAVGEISTLGLTKEILADSGLSAVYFREYLGGISAMPEDLSLFPEKGNIIPSLAAHAPHTTSPELLKALKEKTRNAGLPFSVHLAESEDEMEFLQKARGPWADFLTERGIDFSGWGLPVQNPLHYADSLGLADDKSIFVHLLHAGAEEFRLLKERGSYVCICPRSSQNLHGCLPDLPGMLRAGLSPCLGTDSAASAQSLHILDEMAFTARAFPEISPETVIAMSTVNGAAALGMSDYSGSLMPGKAAAFSYISIENGLSSNILERIIHETSA